MGVKNINRTPLSQLLPQTVSLCDDFHGLDTSIWTATEGDTNGSVAIDADGTGGVVALAVTTSDNEEAYLASNETFKIEAGKPIYALARIQYAEAATDDANVFFGLLDGVGANTIADGGGMKASFDGAVFYKADGETLWRVKSSNATAATDTITEVTAGGSSYQTLAIEVVPQNDGTAEVSYWIDPTGGIDLKQCRANGAHPATPAIKHTVTLASQTEIAVAVGLKNGGANSETLNVDLIVVEQRRF